MTADRDADWWSDVGPDPCDFCSATYYLEVGYHCSVCDRPVCPSCIITLYEWRAAVCPECNAEGGK